MISGFRTIRSVLGMEDGSIELQWPTWSDFEQGLVPIDEDLFKSIVKILKQNRFCLIEGVQASRKTVSAKAIGYRLADCGWGVWYVESEFMNISTALDEVTKLDNSKMLFIIDDCHKNPDAVDWFLRGIISLKKASFLLVSRPVQKTFSERYNSVFDLLKKRGNAISLEVTKELIRRIILSDLSDKVNKTKIPEYLHLVSDQDIDRVLDLTGKDLELLNWLLLSWNPSDNQPIAAVLEKEKLFQFIVSKRLHSLTARKVLLPISAIYQFEIPVQLKFLLKDVDECISKGIILRNPPMPDSRGVFVRLSHPSLAKLYLASAEYHDFLDPQSAISYTLSQLKSYMSVHPINYFGVLRGLYYAKQRNLAKNLCEDETVRDFLLNIASKSETSFFRFCGLIGFVSQQNMDLAKLLLFKYSNTHKVSNIIDEIGRLDFNSLHLAFGFIARVDKDAIKSIFEGLSTDVLERNARSMRIEGVINLLKICKKWLGWSSNEVTNIFHNLGIDFICRELKLGVSTDYLQAITRYSKRFSINDFRTILLSINLRKAFDDFEQIHIAHLKRVITLFAKAGLTTRIQEMLDVVDENEMFSLLRKSSLKKLLKMLGLVHSHSPELHDLFVKKIGVEWIVDNVCGFYDCKEFIRLLERVHNSELKKMFILVLDKNNIEYIAKIASGHSLVNLFYVLLDLDNQAAKILAHIMMRKSLMNKLKRELDTLKKEEFVMSLSSIDLSWAMSARKELGIGHRVEN